MPDPSPSKPTPSFADDATADAAARWLARRDRGLSAVESAEFAVWRNSARAHAAEFDRIAGVWDAAGSLRTDFKVASLAQRVDDRTTQTSRRREKSRTRWAWTGGLAAAAAVAITWTTWSRAPNNAESRPIAAAVELVPATARLLELADGSVAKLRGDSEVRPMFTATERRVRLVRGEAHFHVSKDATRPFVVEAGGLAVRAVGTAFSVRLQSRAVEVTVTEGEITLHETAAPPSPLRRTPTLVAGQRAVVETTTAGGVLLARATIEAATPGEIEQSLSWQGDRLVLTRAKLGDAMDAFNRHSSRRMEIADEALRERRVSGTFRADNADALVRLLEQVGEVKVERREDGVVVLRAVR